MLKQSFLQNAKVTQKTDKVSFECNSDFSQYSVYKTKLRIKARSGTPETELQLVITCSKNTIYKRFKYSTPQTVTRPDAPLPRRSSLEPSRVPAAGMLRQETCPTKQSVIHKTPAEKYSVNYKVYNAGSTEDRS